MTREQLIAALEEHSKEALQKLEAFKQIEADYKQAVKALKALQGEPLGNPRHASINGTGPRKLAKRKLAPSGANREGVFLVLKSHPKGITVSEIAEATGISTMQVHNALRPLRKDLRQLGTRPGTTAVIYALKQ